MQAGAANFPAALRYRRRMPVEQEILDHLRTREEWLLRPDVRARRAELDRALSHMATRADVAARIVRPFADALVSAA